MLGRQNEVKNVSRNSTYSLAAWIELRIFLLKYLQLINPVSCSMQLIVYVCLCVCAPKVLVQSLLQALLQRLPRRRKLLNYRQLTISKPLVRLPILF